MGDKIAQKVDIPAWIKSAPNLLTSCIRGLFDTDGSIYYHRRVCKGVKCFNVGAVFTSLNPPLLNSFYEYLALNGYTAKCDGKRGVWLYREAEVERYLNEVGSHNPKHVLRFKRFLEAKGRFR